MEEVEVIVQGTSLSFKARTDLFKAGQIIAFLNSSQATSQSNYSTPVQNSYKQSLVVGSRKSPRETIIDSGAKTNAQKIVVLADYLLQDGSGKTTFSVNELRPLFARAGEPVPKNFSRDMKEAVLACYITESMEKSGEYELTEKTSEVIQNGFQGEEIKKPRKRSSGNSRSLNTRKGEISSNLKDMDVSPVMSGYKDFHSLPQKGQKILWIFAYAKTHGVDLLTTSEVEFIADKLADHIPTTSFAALNAGNFKNGCIVKSGGKYKIVQKGLDIIAR